MTNLISLPGSYVDARWLGAHGIGRFTQEFLNRCAVENIITSQRIKPASPLDGIFLSWYLKKVNAKFFFTPGFTAPIISNCSYMMTVHDLNHIDCKENSTLASRVYYEKILKPACLRAHKVFTVSEFSKQRILEWSGLAEERVINVGNGVDERFSKIGAVFSIGRPYLFFIGNRKPHKNLHRALNAFARADIPRDIVLLMSGQTTAELDAQLKQLKIQDRVLFVGMIADDDLPSYYRGAVATLFPSLYEGFGLPIIESLRSGTPVITSEYGAMKEVAGGYGVLIDPLSIDSIAAGIELVVSNPNVVDHGNDSINQHIQQYNWDKTFSHIMAEINGLIV